MNSVYRLCIIGAAVEVLAPAYKALLLMRGMECVSCGSWLVCRLLRTVETRAMRL